MSVIYKELLERNAALRDEVGNNYFRLHDMKPSRKKRDDLAKKLQDTKRFLDPQLKLLKTEVLLLKRKS